MKKSLSVLVAAVFVLSLATVALAGSAPGTGIKGTFHDLSTLGRAAALGDANEQANSSETSQNRICIYCHAPHNAQKPDPAGGIFTYMPLWNHQTTAQTVWQMYSNGSDNGNISPIHQSQAMLLATAPGSVSMLCLSCHDGSVATNSYGTNNGITNPSHHTGADSAMTARATIGAGGDLSNHHPIGFDYTQVQSPVDPEIRLTTHALPVVVAGGPQTIGDLLWGGNGGQRMECVSCHDVHNTKNQGVKFTWVNDNQSALCLTCHDKDGTGVN